MKYDRSTVVVTLGRNVGSEPMSPEDWRKFASEVEMAIVSLGAEIIYSPTFTIDGPRGGVGIWEDSREDAAVFISFIDGDYGVRHLTLLLDEIRNAYCQDALGFIVLPGTNHVLTGV